MPTHVVTALHLNLRSDADPARKNVIAVLPQGAPVDKIGDSELAGWFEVETLVAGTTLRGHLNGKFLGAAGTAFPTAHATGGRLPAADLGPKATEKRSVTGSRAYSIGEEGKPSKPSTHPAGKVAGIVRIVDWLDVGNLSHRRWVGGGGKTFCNIYVYDVCDTAGAYIPRVWWTSTAIVDLLAGRTVVAKYGDTVEERRANHIFNWLGEHGPDFGWKRVFDLDTLQSEANAGRMAIICAQRTNMESPGHIQVIVPENGAHMAKRSAAGRVTQPLQSNAGASNFTYGFLGSNWWQGNQFKQFGFWTNDVA
ncbi:MAG: hypothetical protein KIS73_19890 [Enhydrobacter sp.]|nr:hypothetical protein [Enhydrobacter sp.]